MNDKVIAYQFVHHENVPALETLADAKVFKVKQALLAGEKLSRDDKNWLAWQLFSNQGIVRMYGWAFSFRDIVNEYWVEFVYGSGSNHIETRWAPDITSIRANESNVARIVVAQRAGIGK